MLCIAFFFLGMLMLHRTRPSYLRLNSVDASFAKHVAALAALGGGVGGDAGAGVAAEGLSSSPAAAADDAAAAAAADADASNGSAYELVPGAPEVPIDANEVELVGV